MKRFLALIICACALATAQTAMAAHYDKVLLRAGSDGVDAVSVVSLAYLDGALYALDTNKLYIYDGALSAHEYSAPALYEDAESQVHAIMLEDGVLRALAYEYMLIDGAYDTVGLTLYKLAIAPGGAVVFSEPMALDFRALADFDKGLESVRGIGSPFIQDNLMIFTSSTASERVITAYDLTTHDVDEVFIDGLNEITPYTPGEALAIIYEYDKADSSNARARFCALDLASYETRELFAIESRNSDLPSGVLYDARLNKLYYRLDGELYVIEDMRPDTARSVNAISPYSNHLRPVITDDGFYIAGDFGIISAYSLDTGARSGLRLVVEYDYNTDIEQATYSFMDSHAGVEVMLVEHGGDVLSAISTKDDRVDIYAMTADMRQYTSMYARGYLSELSVSDKLTAYVSGMYPFIRERVEKDGEIYALPIELKSESNMGMNVDAMRKLGITKDDMPKTWLELIEFFKAYPALAEAHPGVTLFEPTNSRSDVKSKLFDCFWRDYLQYMLTLPSADMSFDTPAFRAVLKGLSEIDYEALGVPETVDAMAMFFSVFENGHGLINNYAAISARVSDLVFNMPMPLALSQGEAPHIRAELCLLAVNPYSKNKELAIEFLETVADNIPALTLMKLNPNFNAPVENELYGADIALRLSRAEALKAAMQRANERDKLLYQQQIDSLLLEIEDYKQNRRYIASPESIALYRAYALCIIPDKPFGADGDSAAEINMLIQQYRAGAINADAFIKSLDSKLRMMRLEDE